jgi:CBS domain-containing protein
MRVGHIMRSPAVSCPSSASIRDVGVLMGRHNVGNVVVIDAEEIVGIVTDRDIVLRAVATGQPAEAPVAKVMSPDVAVVFLRAEVSEALATMRARQVRRLPVVEAHGRILGVVSLDDIVRSLGTDANEVRELLGAERPADRDLGPLSHGSAGEMLIAGS